MFAKFLELLFPCTKVIVEMQTTVNKIWQALSRQLSQND